MIENCEKCNEKADDLRTLWMACFYAMEELEIPFTKEIIREGGIHDDHPNESHNFYTLMVCKDCRADWLDSIKEWWNAPLKNKESCGSGIYIRRNGATVEVTEEEFNRINPGVIPIKVIKDER